MVNNYQYTTPEVYVIAFKKEILCDCSHMIQDHYSNYYYGDYQHESAACNFCKCPFYTEISNLKFIELINDVTRLYTSK